jgi:hypothetical protein
MSFTINSSGNIGLGTTNQANTPLYIGGGNRPRPIEIKPAANGYAVEIGCQTFVFESLGSMLCRIEEYYNNPAEIEQHFNEHKKLPYQK